MNLKLQVPSWRCIFAEITQYCEYRSLVVFDDTPELWSLKRKRSV